METSIRTDSFSVVHDPASGAVTFNGALRLNGAGEYAPIVALLATAAQQREAFMLDLRGLEFLNSSGIAMLSKFVIDVRNRGITRLTIVGSKTIAWQGKSLVNLQRLMPALLLDFA